VLAQPASSIRLGHRHSTSGYATSRRATAANDGSRRPEYTCACQLLPALEELLATGENFVECILKMGRRLRELFAHLIDVLLVTLLDLFAK
jgi:hypothetical protein